MMSLQTFKALPSPSPSPRRPLAVSKHHQIQSCSSFDQKRSLKKDGSFNVNNILWVLHAAPILAAFEQPALAVTGENYEVDLVKLVLEGGVIAIWYFLLMPASFYMCLHWLRIRWYRRKLLEMYLQFMCVFLFFPGVLLWAPFLNFRKFPRDPSMKYPWDTPKQPEQIKNDYLKFPWASPEDYD